MSDTKEYLLDQIAKRVEKAKEINAEAEHSLRELTEGEQTEIAGLVKQVEEAQIEVKRIEDRENLAAQLEALGTVSSVASSEAVAVPARSIGEAFTHSSEYQAILGQAMAGGMPKFDMPTIEMKAAAGDPNLESDSSTGTAIAPTWFGIETPGLVQWPTLVQDVMNVVQIQTGNSANYPVVTTRTIESQAATAEGAAKKGANFDFDFVTKTLLKWTAFGGASEEMFQDAPTLVNYINTELGRMALQAEEVGIVAALFLAVTASATGSGLAASPTPYDAAREGMAKIEIGGGRATALLVNPLDSAFLDVQRAVAGTGDYFSGGPYQTAQAELWGQIRVVKTPAVSQGTGLMGDFGRGARLFRKGGLRVDSSNSHDDYFRKNLIAIRGEVRSIVGVTYPEFFCEIEFGTS